MDFDRLGDCVGLSVGVRNVFCSHGKVVMPHNQGSLTENRVINVVRSSGTLSGSADRLGARKMERPIGFEKLEALPPLQFFGGASEPVSFFGTTDAESQTN